MSISKKVCLLGDYAVGKTSLLRRFVYDRFDDRYISTIGVRVSRKSVVVPLARGPVDLVLMLWDLAGSEEFNAMRASYLRGAAGAILVCDVTRPETVEALVGYSQQLLLASAGAPLVVAANKIDVLEPSAEGTRIAEVAAALDSPFYYTSARTGLGVEAVFRALGALVLR